jgi:hypothetical protein
MDDCGGVRIQFPPPSSKKDEIKLHGPKEDVKKAEAMLLELAEEQVKGKEGKGVHGRGEGELGKKGIEGATWKGHSKGRGSYLDVEGATRKGGSHYGEAIRRWRERGGWVFGGGGSLSEGGRGIWRGREPSPAIWRGREPSPAIRRGGGALGREVGPFGGGEGATEGGGMKDDITTGASMYVSECFRIW